MLLFSVEKGLFPYRAVIEILFEVETLNHVEFLYGPYILKSEVDGVFDISQAVSRIREIREKYPQPNLINMANRESAHQDWNEIGSVDLSDKTVWGDRTTTKNKFRYLKKMLSLFNFIVDSGSGFSSDLVLTDKAKAQEILELSNPDIAPLKDYYGEWLWFDTHSD